MKIFQRSRFYKPVWAISICFILYPLSFILAKNVHPQTTPLLALPGDEENNTLRGSTPVPWLTQGTFEIYCDWLPVAIRLGQTCGLTLSPHR
ncbi:hypothetical protein Hgul01_00557 [Herpetosiphon gulosus]|uniref:Uncharacterized protein n=1 Tax=Herpetosiphon gulosus TaxID=1973496 RepID=A0ABP9WUA8_9CHLR